MSLFFYIIIISVVVGLFIGVFFHGYSYGKEDERARVRGLKGSEHRGNQS